MPIRAVVLALLLVALLCAGASAAPAPALGQESAEPPAAELEPLLEIMGRVASLYRDSALAFVARERIETTQLGRRRPGQPRIVRPRPERRHTFDYFYIAEESPTGPRLLDYRTRPEDPQAERVQLSTLRLPGYVLRPYSWVFVFLPGNRPQFVFTLEERDEQLGRAADVIRFAPRGGTYRRGVNDAFGRVWIDAETHALLRVDAVRSDAVLRAIDGAVPIPEVGGVLYADELGKGAAYEFHSIRVDYGVEKHGMRLPSRARLAIGEASLPEEGEPGFRAAALDIVDRGIRDAAARIEHRFSDYRFFSIRTAEGIYDFIRGVIR